MPNFRSIPWEMAEIEAVWCFEILQHCMEYCSSAGSLFCLKLNPLRNGRNEGCRQVPIVLYNLLLFLSFPWRVALEYPLDYILKNYLSMFWAFSADFKTHLRLASTFFWIWAETKQNQTFFYFLNMPKTSKCKFISFIFSRDQEAS